MVGELDLTQPVRRSKPVGQRVGSDAAGDGGHSPVVRVASHYGVELKQTILQHVHMDSGAKNASVRQATK